MKFIEPIYRPPTEADSMLVQIMQSCNWNKCNFCYRRKDYPILIATPEEVKEQLATEAKFYPPGASVFLVGSNAFAIPCKTLLKFLELVRDAKPNFKQVAMFSRVDAIAKKSDEELKALREAGVRHLYVGTESGNDEDLRLMNKGHVVAEALEQLKRLDKAGITYTAFYIIGMGGKNTVGRGKDMAEFINAAKPARVISTGMTVTSGTGVAELEKRGDYVQASEREKIEELREFLQNAHSPTFYDGIHMLNPLHFRLPLDDGEQKARAIAEIDAVLKNCDDTQLEAAINRPAMAKMSEPPK